MRASRRGRSSQFVGRGTGYPPSMARRPQDLIAQLTSGGYAALRTVWPDPQATAMPVRMGGRRALLVRGEDGVRLFYDTLLFRRRHAVPAVVANPLFGRGAVHGLDDHAHTHRKAVFLASLDRLGVAALADAVDASWQERQLRWPQGQPVRVFDEAVEILGDAVLTWAGVQPRPGPGAAADLATMVEGFGSASVSEGARRRMARRRCEAWAAEAVRASRTAQRDPEHRSPLDRIARATDLDGAPLDERTAAVELLNLLRPTVAVAWFVAFAAVAIAEHPELRDRLRSEGGEPAWREAFAHELRRSYPFVPVLAARARSSMTWQGHRLPQGHRLVLDIWGTNHFEMRWPAPDEFRPERFVDQTFSAYDFVPQGGGEPLEGHRCPGEPATVQILARCGQRLADLDYEIAPADRRFSMRRMPTRPPSGPSLRRPASAPP
jgi:fatty-acid peroxygenase